MKILVTSMIRNEERIIPYFIHHYSEIADKIVLVDHESTDKTVEVATRTAKDTGVELEILTLKNEGFDEHIKKVIFENTYKRYRDSYDICIVVDGDEFLHHPKGTRDCIENAYKSYGDFVIQPYGYQMYSKEFPKYSGVKITELLTEGVEGTSNSCKKVCFSTNLNLKANYGMHISNHYDDSGEEAFIIHNTGMMLLHYSSIEVQHRLDSFASMRSNLSDRGKEMLKHGINRQLEFTEDYIVEEFEKHYERREHLKL
tara:strand:+ start:1292 stop:2062 length:771 start_codon:yes stop_codon:yes gene_type:complete